MASVVVDCSDRDGNFRAIEDDAYCTGDHQQVCECGLSCVYGVLMCVWCVDVFFIHVLWSISSVYCGQTCPATIHHTHHTPHMPHTTQMTGADVYIRHALLLLVSFVGLCFFFFLLMQLAQGAEGIGVRGCGDCGGCLWWVFVVHLWCFCGACAMWVWCVCSVCLWCSHGSHSQLLRHTLSHTHPL